MAELAGVVVIAGAKRVGDGVIVDHLAKDLNEILDVGSGAVDQDGQGGAQGGVAGEGEAFDQFCVGHVGSSIEALT